jgi:hypothetical protein
MQRRAGLRAGQGQPAVPLIPPIPQQGRGRGRARGHGQGGRAPVQVLQQPAPVLPQPAPVILPPIIQQQIIQPIGPLPPNLPAIIPPLPGNPRGDFEHVLEFIIGLETQPKRDKILLNAGCTVVEDLLYVESESLLSCLELDTPIISKTRLKTLKKWAEDTFDVFGMVDIAGFTLDVCKENQRTMARSSKPSTSTTTVTRFSPFSTENNR